MKIRIKNFRCFKDTNLIDIKPITILIGRNSAGKSSFLKTFPMLKQSFKENTKTPLLLFGDYVDFGSYADIKPVFEEDKEESYELGFVFGNDIFSDINRLPRRTGYMESFYFSRSRYDKREFFDIGLDIKFEEDKRNLLHAKELIYNLNNNKIKLY